MPETVAFLCWPQSTIRTGTHPKDLEKSRGFPRSDTLFGALCWATAAIEGTAALEGLLKRFQGAAPPFLISSALPVVRTSSGFETFVPLPVRPRAMPDTARGEDRKLLRRAAWIQASLLRWFDGVEGQESPQTSADILLDARLLHEIQESGKVRSPWSDATVRPRVAVDRISGASHLFSGGYAFFLRDEAAQAGFLVQAIVDSGRHVDLLRRLFELLAIAGIGGERSTGAGGFALDGPVDPLLPVNAAPRGLSLSLISPRQEELESGLLSPAAGRGYRLVERSGWCSSPAWSGRRSRPVVMLAEGSYAGTASPPAGRIVDVTPDPTDQTRHRVYRYGLGLFLDEEGRAP